MSPPERSLYLFFLDRELGEAVGYQLDSSAARRITAILLSATGARLLCGISLLYENTNLDRATFGFFSRLIAAGALDVISHHLSHEEFIASRIALYTHDAGRYPAYFGRPRPHVIQPTVYKPGGTTSRIVSGMTQWAFRIPELDPKLGLTSTQLRGPVLKALSERDERALTYSLFRPYLKGLADSPVAEGHIRRVISRLFASDYRDFGTNDIPTGLRGLGYFEQELARDFPFYDVAILGEIIRRTGLDLSDDRAGRKVESLLAGRGFEAHALLVATIRWTIAAVADVLGAETLGRQDEARYRILDILRRLTSVQSLPGVRPASEDLYALAATNAGILVRQLRDDRRLADAFARLRDEYLPPPRADVLLVVATEIESESLIEVFAEGGYARIGPKFSVTNAYHMFSAIAGTRVAVVRCSMGGGGPGGPELTVAEAISVLKPTSVIMVGIAFGISAHEARIGDVLISTQVFDYELMRVGTSSGGSPISLSRGARPEASPRLLSRFRMARLHNCGLRVREGIILSGKKLVDNVDYRDSLRAMCAEAIGGEMEGQGVYAAAERLKVDWIVVKSICDWADGNKSTRLRSRQSLAARNASLAVLRTIEQGGLAP